MADEKFKLPGSSYDELAKIIKTYGHIDKPESLAEISSLSGMNATAISRNAGFLTSIGILESGALKFPTNSGKELAHALEYDITEDIKICWRKIVSGNDFFEKLLAAIKIRNGMDEETLEVHIAYSAGQPKKERSLTGARTIVDILRVTGLIVESDGRIITTVEAPRSVHNQVEQEAKREQEIPSIVNQPIGINASTGVGISLSIRVNINCTPSDLGELSGKLKSLIKEFSLDHEDGDESA